MKKPDLFEQGSKSILTSGSFATEEDMQEKYKVIVENSINAFFLTIPDGTILETNKAALSMFGYSNEEFKSIRRQDIFDHTDPVFLLAIEQRKETGNITTEATGIKKNGERFPVEISSAIFTAQDGTLHASTMVADITEKKSGDRKFTEARRLIELDRIEKTVLENIIRSGSNLELTMSYYLNEIEQVHPGMLCSVLKLHDNRLFNWASPNLPAKYIEAIEGVVIGDNVGSCGTAAFKKEKIIVADIENDGRWAAYKDIALKEGLRSCWSFPITNAKNQVLGTFAIYYKEVRTPSPEEEKTIERAGNILQVILENKITEATIEESEQRYKIFVQQSSEGIWRVELPEPLHINTPVDEMVACCYHNAWIAECNDAFARMYRFENAAAVIGLPLKQLMPDDNPANIAYLYKFFANGFKIREEVTHENDKDGNEQTFVNNMTGIVEGEFIKRAWGTQRDVTDRVKTRIALRESENRYKMFIQQSTEGVWRVEYHQPLPLHLSVEEQLVFNSGNGYIAECNDSMAQMYGYKKAEELIGMPLDQILPRHTQENQLQFKRFISSGYKLSDSISIEKDKNGNEKIFLNNLIGIIEDGFLIRIWGTQRDITTQKKAELALAESENRLRTIVQTEPQCIKLIDKDGKLLEMNPAGLAMVEADSIEQLIGQDVSNIVVAEEHKNAFRELNRKVFNGESGILEFGIIGLKGTKRWLETHAVPLKNAEGKITALLGVTRDITKNKEAEEHLNQANLLRENLISTVDGIVWASSADSAKFEFVSDKAERMLGYPVSQWLNEERFWENHIHPDDREKAIEFMERETNAKRSHQFEYRMMAADGRIIWVKDIVSVIIENDEPVKLRGIIIDITEKVLLENSLADERQLRQQQITDAVITGQEKERSELGEELHDNINQILATTKLYIESALLDKEMRRDLIAESKILVETAMIEIRKLSKSLLPPSLGEIGLIDALDELISNIEPVNPLNISKDWELFTEDVMTEKLKLTIFRIVQEQLNNILKHASATGVIISLKREGSLILLQIKDDGVGFDTLKKRTGVGLKNIISRAEVNNGKVIIESAPAEGCTLKVSFAAQAL